MDVLSQIQRLRAQGVLKSNSITESPKPMVRMPEQVACMSREPVTL